MGRDRKQQVQDMSRQRVNLTLSDDEYAFIIECWKEAQERTHLDMTLTGFVKAQLFSKLMENKRI